MRAFVAFDVDAETLAWMARMSERLRAAMPSGLRASFLSPEKMHVTAKFLGETSDEQAPILAEAVRALAAKPAPRARAAGLDAFGSPKRAHVVVLALDDLDGALARIAADLESRAASLGFARETRGYRPHLTLARLRPSTDVRRWLAAAPPSEPRDVAIAALTLYRSDAAAGGVVYTPLARAPFTAR